jgi:CRP/FNR family transcriptional regulator
VINELKKLFGHVFEKDLLQEIALHGRLLEVAEQVELIDIGQPIKGIPLLLSGALKISREDAHGDELLLYYVEKGESCAMSFTWELNQRKSKIRAVTEVPSKIITAAWKKCSIP